MTEQDLLDIIETARAAWITSVRAIDTTDMGWFISNDDTPLQCGIERDDEMAKFEGDLEAVVHVCKLAALGDIHARGALILHTLCNELRALVWGPTWVNSRLGPE